MKNILELNHVEARKFFLKDESYFSIDLPGYFKFSELLNSDELRSMNTCSGEPANFDNVNYKIWHNKDGEYSWRLFQLIHPVLYVFLVNKITGKEEWDYIVKRFKENFQSNKNIECASIPVQQSAKEKSDKAEQISSWWNNVEQRSIEHSLEYSYMIRTDIVSCYGSLYTHSVEWALLGKKQAKEKKGRGRAKRIEGAEQVEAAEQIGKEIDKILRDMAYGQTNGIPEGSVLMDFIAEIVLGYIDAELSGEIAEDDKDYKIIRYRDDYRIFVNDPGVGKIIVKKLSYVLSEIGMKIKAEKTICSNDIIRDSIKPDKLFWLSNSKIIDNPRKQLIIVLELSRKYPNSGAVVSELQRFYKSELQKFYGSVKEQKSTLEDIDTLISIVVEIGFRNPKTYPIVSAILSKFLDLQETAHARKNIKRIMKKFSNLPNTEHLDLWLQRVTLKIDDTIEYPGKLCQKVRNSSIDIWNSKWITNNDILNIMSSANIIDIDLIGKMEKTITEDEVSLFGQHPYW